jgi:hypothetical protein
MLGNGPRRRRKVLGVSWGFEPVNAPLAYSCVGFVKSPLVGVSCGRLGLYGGCAVRHASWTSGNVPTQLAVRLFAGSEGIGHP